MVTVDVMVIDMVMVMDMNMVMNMVMVIVDGNGLDHKQVRCPMMVVRCSLVIGLDFCCWSRPSSWSLTWSWSWT